MIASPSLHMSSLYQTCRSYDTIYRVHLKRKQKKFFLTLRIHLGTRKVKYLVFETRAANQKLPIKGTAQSKTAARIWRSALHFQVLPP